MTFKLSNEVDIIYCQKCASGKYFFRIRMITTHLNTKFLIQHCFFAIDYDLKILLAPSGEYVDIKLVTLGHENSERGCMCTRSKG